jgi:hypothetical protein
LKRLLIAIPTYKRFYHLNEQLTRLKKLIKLVNNVHIEVLVQDNDDSESIRELTSDFGYNYKSNPTNYGADMNMILCFYASVGYDYFWLLSDDDLIIVESMCKVLSNINLHDDLIVIQHKDQQLIQAQQSKTYHLTDFDEFMKLGTGLISSSIYNVKSFYNYYDELIKYWHTGFPHLRIQLSLLKSSRIKLTLWIGDFFTEERVTSLSDDLGYKKALYGFLGLFDDMPKSLQSKMAIGWWKSIKQRYLAVKWRKHSRLNFILWKDFMKRNLLFFEWRYFLFKFSLYPFGSHIEKYRKEPIIKKLLIWLEKK